MRFSLQSLAICLVSTQARLTLASPCKPLTTTTALAATTTTTAVAEASTTTAITDDSTTTTAGDTTIITSSEAITTTAVTPSEDTTTTAVIVEPTPTLDATTTTTLAEESTTTAITAEPTTTTFEATTTTAAETTTTTEALEGTQISAVFADNTEKDTYIDRWGGTYSVPQEEGSTSKARFQLEPETNRLFTYLVDGTKVYLFTVIPTGPNYAFQFDTPANIDPYPNTYHYVQCTPDANNILSCASESGPTPIVWYWSAGNERYYGNKNPNFNSEPVVHFRLE
ncbi:hypothetical protein FDENT_11923 [Fusarium denticulatum]|uniref:Uncharacterized protein n=1 Tax=Fusarium denticulatum TaxID=48507 RepID=A0A8H5TEW7_9HYPO|nr:hypothetical protein FDENT_11923 [Fusarium denticulatum]